jgi:hypothetical protein
MVAKEERAVPGRYFVPAADIDETEDTLAVVLEMPGVEKRELDVALETDVLNVDGRTDFSKCKDMEQPHYTEYNVGIVSTKQRAERKERDLTRAHDLRELVLLRQGTRRRTISGHENVGFMSCRASASTLVC